VKKIAQNVAQPIFWSKLLHNFYLGKKWPRFFGFFCNFLKKLPQENIRPMGEKNHRNPVTLIGRKGGNFSC
jgi:hypothetical protein